MGGLKAIADEWAPPPSPSACRAAKPATSGACCTCSRRSPAAEGDRRARQEHDRPADLRHRRARHARRRPGNRADRVKRSPVNILDSCRDPRCSAALGCGPGELGPWFASSLRCSGCRWTMSGRSTYREHTGRRKRRRPVLPGSGWCRGPARWEVQDRGAAAVDLACFRDYRDGSRRRWEPCALAVGQAPGAQRRFMGTSSATSTASRCSPASWWSTDEGKR